MENIFLGVQNISTEEKGSLTGEVSALHLKQYKVKYSIVGHSERRKMGESDEMINKKVKLCLQNKIIPVLCVGESIRDDHGEYLEQIKNQINLGLKGVSKTEIMTIIVAYEPVWAIGASVPMQTNDIHEMYLYIKKCLKEVYGSLTDSVRILYGGAVNKDNSGLIVKNGNVDGLLVGRDSLDPNNFSEIVKSAI
jgi:triosephosphate isomerase